MYKFTKYGEKSFKILSEGHHKKKNILDTKEQNVVEDTEEVVIKKNAVKMLE